MRILFFADNFYPETNAPGTHIYERCRLWARDGHQVTVITTAPNAPERKLFAGYQNTWRQVEQIDGIRVVRVKSYISPSARLSLRSLDYASLIPSGVFHAVREKRPDVVISSSPPLFTAMAGEIYAKWKRIPHVFELRDLWPRFLPTITSLKPGIILGLLEKLELSLYRASTRVLAFAQGYAADLIARGIPAEKIDVVFNGANLDLFSPSAEKDSVLLRELGLQGKFVIGFLGTLGLAQGLENALEAARELREAPIQILLIGGGIALESLQIQARQMGLKNVTFIPRQTKQELRRYWSVCDASLVHLRDEASLDCAIPSKIFESMAVGLPMVYVGPPGEAANLVKSRNAGIVVSAGQPRALADAIRRMVSEPALRAELAKCSLASASEFTRERQAQRTLEVLQTAIQDYHHRK